MWTDSECVLKQIFNRTSNYRAYVANRLSKIHAATKVCEWRYVDSNATLRITHREESTLTKRKNGASSTGDPIFFAFQKTNGPRRTCLQEKRPTSRKSSSTPQQQPFSKKKVDGSTSSINVRNGTKRYNALFPSKRSSDFGGGKTEIAILQEAAARHRRSTGT